MSTNSFSTINSKSPGIVTFLTCLLLAGMLTGCMSRPSLGRQTFALEPTPATNTAAASQSDSVLAIRTLEVSPLFEGRSFVYRTAADRYQMDPYAGFLVSSTRALSIPMRDLFRDSGAFKSVVEQGSQLKADTYAEIYVTELYGDFRPSTQPAAVLSIRMLFFDAKDTKHQPFMEKNYVKRIPIRQKTAAALVAGWNQALTETMSQVTADVTAARNEAIGMATSDADER